MSDRAQRGSGNLAALVLTYAFRFGGSFVVSIALMRFLGVEGFGTFGYIGGLGAVCVFATDLGLFRLLTREIARSPSRCDVLVSTGLRITLLLSILTTLVMGAIVALTSEDRSLAVPALLAGLALSIQALYRIINAAFHGFRRMKLQVSGQLWGRLLLLLSTFGLLAMGAGITAVFAAQVVGALLTLLIYIRVYKRNIGSFIVGVPRHLTRKLLHGTLPFGLNIFFANLYLGVDVIMLEHFHGDAQVGLYRAAAVLILNIPVLAEILSAGLYPKMSRHVDEPEKAATEMRFTARMLLALSVPIAMGGMCLAEPLVVMMGGQDYAAAALPLLVMLPLLPLRFLNNGQGMALSAMNLQKDRTRGVFLAALFNLVANFIAIPAYGATGAAATTLLTELLLGAFFAVRLRQVIRNLGILESLVRSLLPSAVMAVTVLYVPLPNVLLSILAGAGVYAVLGFLARAWRWSDLARLRGI